MRFADRNCSPPAGSESAVTGPDGGFSLRKNVRQTAHDDTGACASVYAEFAGDEQYAASASASVNKLC